MITPTNMKKLYEEYIEDVALEVSIDKKFRQILKNIPFYYKIEISQITAGHCFYLKDILSLDLIFYVEKVESCPESFDDSLTIFKFTADKFPEIVRYTGNNL